MMIVQPMDDALVMVDDAVFGSVSEEDLMSALEMVINEAVEEVMNCTNLQPSVPGVVCEVISDIVRSAVVSDADVTAAIADTVNGSTVHADVTAAVTDSVNGSADTLPAESTCHDAQVC